MAWTPADLGNAIRNFPTLAVAGSGSVSGNLSVVGAMLGGQLILNPTEEHLAHAEAQATFIADSYTIEFGFSRPNPFLKVLGSRVQETANRYGKRLIDLHVYSDQTTCYGAPQELMAEPPTAMTPVEFIYRYVQPFLYAQAFFERHGFWPWGDLAHGHAGLIEWLGKTPHPTNADILRTILFIDASGEEARKHLRRRARWHLKCPCGSGKQIRYCHPGYKRGVDTIRTWVAQGYSARHRNLILPLGS
ncbi:MAG: hypothetical protein HONBIEJF_02569 [Fimbriimonadaceae bacterium]|nr:hypothetical protein [Fimbriimonadaceae bacterium]